MPDHDLATIGTRHPDGSDREVFAYIAATARMARDMSGYDVGDPVFYARGTFSELLAAQHNPDLHGATYAIDKADSDGGDRRHLCAGQPVTLADIRAIVARGPL